MGDTSMMIEVAINKLAVAQDETMRWEILGFCRTEEDFNAIKIEDNKSFNFTWSDVLAKAEELEQEKQTEKDNKLSAYRKLSMTDDEIKAIDPTLLSED